MSDSTRFFPIGDSALTVEFGNMVSPDLNKQAVAFSALLEEHPFPGFVEAVPAYASVSIFYDIFGVRAAYPEAGAAFEAVRSVATGLIGSLTGAASADEGMVEIPMHFGGDDGPDLEYVAEMHGIDGAEVVRLFLSETYRVYMLGFLPGFTYMGSVSERIATPRKAAPRMKVGKGSVGIAGRQTGVYSLESPGGWQIIGRTDVDMFTPYGDRLTKLQPGDQVKFISA
jgi:inhibitor of KinA